LNFLKGAESVYVFEEYFQMVIIRIRNWHWWLERMDRQWTPITYWMKHSQWCLRCGCT